MFPRKSPANPPQVINSCWYFVSKIVRITSVRPYLCSFFSQLHCVSTWYQIHFLKVFVEPCKTQIVENLSILFNIFFPGPGSNHHPTETDINPWTREEDEIGRAHV